MVRSCSRWPLVSWSCSSPVSASTRYAAKAPASRRNRVLDSDTSPHRKPIRCSRASSTTMASTSRLTVSWRTPAAEQRAVRQRELQVPGDQDRVERLAVGVEPVRSPRRSPRPTGCPAGSGRAAAGTRARARCSSTSLTAYTSWPTRTNRTTCREMPRGRATSFSSGHSSSGVVPGQGDQPGIRLRCQEPAAPRHPRIDGGRIAPRVVRSRPRERPTPPDSRTSPPHRCGGPKCSRSRLLSGCVVSQARAGRRSSRRTRARAPGRS